MISEPSNPEVDRVHALIAAHRAMDRSRGSTSHDDGWERFSGTELSSMTSRDRLPSIAEKSIKGHDDGSKVSNMS